MNARAIVRVNGVVALTLGMALAISLVPSWLYGVGAWANFLFPGWQ